MRVTEQAFDIWHEVPLVPQLTGMSCWAAAAAMIIGWRDCLDINPQEVAWASGRWSDYRDGMHPNDIDGFARAWGLHIEPAELVTTARLRELLEQNGPLWVGEGSAGLHVIVVAGAFGDGTPEGTFLRVLDPWPAGLGSRYVLTGTELFKSLQQAGEISGVQTRILHTGGRGCGASRSEYRVREESSAFVQFDQPEHEERYAEPRFGTAYGLLQKYAPAARRRPALHPPSNGGGQAHAQPAAAARASVATLDAADDMASHRDRKIDDTDWYIESDLSGEPMGHGLLTAAGAAWAEDDRSPDFSHLGHTGSSLEFEISGNQLLELFLLNGFDITGGQDEVLFGLRGCALTGTTEQGRFLDAALLTEDQPDHVGYHCVLGVYRRSTNQIAVFPGSTVPNWSLMEQQRAAGAGAQIANLLPTGCYTHHVGQHRAVKGAFILQPDVAVLRSRDNLVYEVSDEWEKHSPGDNIHPGFTGHQALFSSAGCQTVPGRWSESGGHQGTWADFRAAAGLGPDNNSGWGGTYTYCLLTGREARLIGEVPRKRDLARLRFGSRGDAVRSLQESLTKAGLLFGALDSRMGADTTLALVRWQQDRESRTADGIVTPALADELGVDLGW